MELVARADAEVVGADQADVAVAVAQREARGDLGDAGGLADPGGPHQGEDAALVQHLALAHRYLAGEEEQRLAPGQLQIVQAGDALHQPLRDVGRQPELHQALEEFLHVRGALSQVVPAHAGKFRLQPAAQVLHLLAHRRQLLLAHAPLGGGARRLALRLLALGGGGLVTRQGTADGPGLAGGCRGGSGLPPGRRGLDVVRLHQVHGGGQFDTFVCGLVGEDDGILAEGLAHHA